MKRSFCLILCLLLSLSMLLTSCDEAADQNHKHTYSASWSSNEGGHWYAATCEHNDQKANMATHTDAENDGICDVCNYGADHVHTYETGSWANDEFNHWNAVTCGHRVDPANKAAHADSNNDGACDTCGFDNDHDHTYDTKQWTSDATHHYHAVTCGHAVEPADKAEHVDVNQDGICEVCKWKDGAHTHTWATVFSSDATGHWYAATCHIGASKDFAAHIDANVDGKCDVCEWYEKSHTHTFFEDVWSRNDDGHWHAASCGHTGVKDAFAAHTTGADGACTVCGFTTHEHSFSDAWTSDATHHWHANTCTSQCDAKDYYLAHTDKNADGVCDVCAWKNASHTHEYTTLGRDAKNHWYACSDHSGAMIDVEAHYDSNDDGICDFCEYSDPTHEHTFNGTEYAYDAQTHWVAADCHTGAKKEGTEGAHSDSANDGFCDICFCVTFDSVVDKATSEEATNIVKKGSINNNGEDFYFEFGQDYYHQMGLGTDGFEYWYSLYNGEIFGVYDAGLGTGVSKVYYATLANLNGFNVEICYGNVLSAYGVSDTIRQLYDAAKASETFFCSYENDVYVFGADFNYNDSAIPVVVTFTMNQHVSYDADWNESYTDFVDYCKIEYVDSFGDSYTIEIKQTAGVRTAQNAQTADKYLINDFDLTDENGNAVADGATIELQKGSELLLNIVGLTPNSASFDFDELTVIALDSEGNEVYYHINAYVNGNAEDGYYISLSTGYSTLAQVYTVTLKTANVSYTLKIDVKLPKVFYIETQVYSEEYWSYTLQDSITVYEGITVQFKGAVNTDANAAYTVALTSGDAENTVLQAGTEPYYNSFFTANKTGTYVLTITSVESTTENPLTCQLTVTVVEAPKVSDILNGKYVYSDWYDSAEVTFTPSAEGATDGKAVIVINGVTYNVDYAYADGNINLFDGDAPFSSVILTLNPNFTLTIVFNLDSWWPTEGTMEKWSPLNAVAGEYRSPFISTEDPRYTIVLNKDGTGYFAKIGYNPMIWGWAEYYSSQFTWSFSETETAGVYNITFTLGEYADAPEFDVATVNASCVLDTNALEATLTTSILIEGVATSLVFTVFI